MGVNWEMEIDVVGPGTRLMYTFFIDKRHYYLVVIGSVE